MYEKNYLIILGIVILIAIGGFAIVQKQSVTGMIVPGTPTTPVQKPMLTGAPSDYWHEVELQDRVDSFFGTDKFVFLKDSCSKITEELLDDVKTIKTTDVEEFTAGNSVKFKTIIFKEPKALGKITLLKGFDKPDSVTIHFTQRKMVMTIDGWKEIMDLDIKLHGNEFENRLYFEKGNVKVLDFECEFGG